MMVISSASGIPSNDTHVQSVARLPVVRGRRWNGRAGVFKMSSGAPIWALRPRLLLTCPQLSFLKSTGRIRRFTQTNAPAPLVARRVDRARREFLP